MNLETFSKGLKLPKWKRRDKRFLHTSKTFQKISWLIGKSRFSSTNLRFWSEEITWAHQATWFLEEETFRLVRLSLKQSTERSFWQQLDIMFTWTVFAWYRDSLWSCFIWTELSLDGTVSFCSRIRIQMCHSQTNIRVSSSIGGSSRVNWWISWTLMSRILKMMEDAVKFIDWIWISVSFYLINENGRFWA